MEKNSTCFSIFHIPKLGKDYQRRFGCYLSLKQILSIKYDNLNNDTIKIQNEEDYINFKEKHFSLNLKDLLTYGEIGLWASNLLTFKKFLESDYEYLFVFEDDVVLETNFFDLFEKYKNQLPDDFDLFTLHTRDMEFVRFSGEEVNGVVPLYQWWDTGAVFYSRSGVEKILKAVESNGIDCPVDLFFFDCKKKNDDYVPKELDQNEKHPKKYNFNSYALSPKAKKLLYKITLESNIWLLERIDFNKKTI